MFKGIFYIKTSVIIIYHHCMCSFVIFCESPTANGSNNLYLLVSSVDNLCKQFGARSGPTLSALISKNILKDLSNAPSAKMLIYCQYVIF